VLLESNESILVIGGEVGVGEGETEEEEDIRNLLFLN